MSLEQIVNNKQYNLAIDNLQIKPLTNPQGSYYRDFRYVEYFTELGMKYNESSFKVQKVWKEHKRRQLKMSI